MKGIVQMKVTQEMMAAAFKLYWKEMQGYDKLIPNVVKITQCKNREYFIIDLEDAP